MKLIAERVGEKQKMQFVQALCERPCVLPRPRKAHFTGRNELLNRMWQFYFGVSMRDNADESSSDGGLVVTTDECVVVHDDHSSVARCFLKGLGGIGKTEVAVEFASRAFDAGLYTGGVMTIRANTASSIHISLREFVLRSLARHPEERQRWAREMDTDPWYAWWLVRRWLVASSGLWLIVFDNADEPDKLLSSRVWAEVVGLPDMCWSRHGRRVGLVVREVDH